MNKDELIKIVNALVDARAKRIISENIEQISVKVKKEILEQMKTQKTHLNSNRMDLKNLLGMDDSFDDKLVSNKKNQSKTYSKDPKINAILRQTAEELHTSPNSSNAPLDEYKKLLSEEYSDSDLMKTFNFDTSDMNAIASKRITPEIEGKVALEIAKKQVEAQTGSPEIAQAMFKDYRSLMKKVDEKAKTKRTGV